MKNEKLRHVYDCPSVVEVQLVSDGATMQTLSNMDLAPAHVDFEEDIF